MGSADRATLYSSAMSDGPIFLLAHTPAQLAGLLYDSLHQKLDDAWRMA